MSGFTYVLMASTPILVVLMLMIGLRQGGTRAGPAGWLAALAVAALVFGAGRQVIIVSQLKAVLLSLYVLYIIWFALLLFYVVREAGALQAIGAGVARLTTDRTVQLLALSWVFASFLQGVTGFGVPVAVVAPLLVGLGFPAVTSVVAASIGHGWAVTFGSLGSSFIAMAAVTGLDEQVLAPWSAGLLSLAAVPSGLVVAYLHDGRASFARALPIVLVTGSAMGATQYLLATNGFWSLAAFVAGLVGLVTIAVMVRLLRSAPEAAEAEVATSGEEADMGLAKAMAAYIVLLIVVLAARLIPPVSGALDAVRIAPHFRETVTGLGWVNAPGVGQSISVFGHGGALIFYACLIAFLIYRWLGCYSAGAAGRIVRGTVSKAWKPTVGIFFLVGMATLMTDSGMTYRLASGLSRASGPAFPFVAPFIGALGAFVTGSNTNSNVLFAPLQQSTAELLGVNVLLVLGAQNLGGAIGSVIAPAKMIVGCSTAGLGGEEGLVMRLTTVRALALIVFGGLLVLALSLYTTAVH